jgi:ribonuclease HI
METGESYFIFTDGACSGNPGPGGWAAVVIGDGRLKELGGRDPGTTNNRMELIAAIESLKNVPRSVPVKLVSDSSYLIKGITEWLRGWKFRGWKKADGEPVLNSDLWRTLDDLVFPGIEWIHVAGHAGHYLNERCDKIAVAFSHGEKLRLRDIDLMQAEDLNDIRQAIAVSLKNADAREKTRTAARKPGSAPHGPKAQKTYLFIYENQVYRFRNWPDCKAFSNGRPGYPKACISRPEEEEYVKNRGLSLEKLDRAIDR